MQKVMTPYLFSCSILKFMEKNELLWIIQYNLYCEETIFSKKCTKKADCKKGRGV